MACITDTTTAAVRRILEITISLRYSTPCFAGIFVARSRAKPCEAAASWRVELRGSALLPPVGSGAPRDNSGLCYPDHSKRSYHFLGATSCPSQLAIDGS